MASKKKQTVGYKYFASCHFVLCHGPVDAITKISFQDKDAYSNEEVTNKTININKPNLFGGNDQQGGVEGNVELLFGDSTQQKNSTLQRICASISNSFNGLVSAYRGVCSVVFDNVYIGTSPSMPDSKWRVKRIHTRHDGEMQWYDSKAEINSVYYNQNGEVLGDPIANFIENHPNSPFVKPVLDGIYGSGGWGMGGDGEITKTNVSSCKPDGSDCSYAQYIYRTSFNEYIDQPIFIPNCSISLADSYYPNSVLSTYIKSIAGGSYVCVAKLDNNIEANIVSLQREVNLSYVPSATPPDPIQINISELSQEIKEKAKEGDAASQMLIDVAMQDFESSGADINPAHIIRECLTNPIWGIGVSELSIDDASFRRSADTLYTESMGISIKWTDSTSINEFIDNIKEHINAQLYLDRITNKWKLYLIREDYIVSDLISLDESNIQNLDFERRTLAECVNAVTVTYYDRERSKDSTVTVQDIARIAQQGGVIAQSIDYKGFSNSVIASRIALRDLKTLSSTLASISFEVDESLSEEWFLGMPFKLSDTGYGLEQSVMRVSSIKRGDGISNSVYIEAIEDSFSSPMQSVVEYILPIKSVNNEAKDAESIIFEVPYIELVEMYGEDEVDSKLEKHPDLGYVGMAAIRPNNQHINANLYANSGAGYDEKSTLDFCPNATLKYKIGYMDSSFTLENIAEFDLLKANNRIQMNDEIMAFVSFDAITKMITVKRGCFDTTPQKHDAGSIIFGWDNYSGIDSTEYLQGEIVSLKALTLTGSDALQLNAATSHSVTCSARAIRPYPPGNFKINNQYFPAVAKGSISLSWSSRNRLQQTGGEPLGFQDGSVAHEEGSTYSVYAYNHTTNELKYSETNITALTHVVSVYALLGISTVRLEVFTVRDGFSSYQPQRHVMEWSSGENLMMFDDVYIPDNGNAVVLQFIE